MGNPAAPARPAAAACLSAHSAAQPRLCCARPGWRRWWRWRRAVRGGPPASGSGPGASGRWWQVLLLLRLQQWRGGKGAPGLQASAWKGHCTTARHQCPVEAGSWDPHLACAPVVAAAAQPPARKCLKVGFWEPCGIVGPWQRSRAEICSTGLALSMGRDMQHRLSFEHGVPQSARQAAHMACIPVPGKGSMRRPGASTWRAG